MKYILWVIGFGLMFWALIEQTKEHPNLYIQIVAVVVFFIALMRLMNDIPSKNESNKESDK